MGFITKYFAIINGFTFSAVFTDKVLAKLHWTRIPEKMFHLCSLLGGGAGGLFAMILANHKISKRSFMLPYIGCTAVNAMIIYLIYY